MYTIRPYRTNMPSVAFASCAVCKHIKITLYRVVLRDEFRRIHMRARLVLIRSLQVVIWASQYHKYGFVKPLDRPYASLTKKEDVHLP